MKKICRVFKIIILGVLAVVLLTGCTQSAEPEEIVIGVAWPFATNNNLFNEGIDLAVREINDKGGINGKELKLLKEDDGSEVVRGIIIARSFTENKSVRAVVGHRNSFVSIPASVIYEQAGLVMLSPASTAPQLTRNEYQYIFRIIPSDHEITRQLAGYLAQQGYRRMVIYYTADSYGAGLANSFESEANAQGITIVDRVFYYAGLEDLRHLHKRWQAFGYDGVFIAGSVSEGASFIRDAGQAGINGPFFGGNALDSPLLAEIGGQAAEGTVISSVFNPGSNRPEVKKFVADFLREYEQMPNSYAALGYDAVKMLAAAMEKAAGTNRSAVAEELRNLGSWPGVTGIHELNETGDNLGDLVVLKKLAQGKFEHLER